ncbi:DnaJ-like, subfamily C, domain-containing protein [Alkalidesulfovibrio alkalitolerans DSM 16529]|jgi:hypothetical protein|uniref:DnaJ-like, subfamily C, domain-containing protein n=1 Tax=Alkalidesulfovibrio alkalitolerans DSM 16529 TaxID=1121439 RepID=S7TBE9_9BACT|nr:DUF1992 domain-containing protein [Alkalidesulfovibrio alkalitolerans]EPR34482.1 DnaJ-like, subfamily C, domain-containing protein [Alkalidesulfovibrio alkalitolerans DSM 16529]
MFSAIAIVAEERIRVARERGEFDDLPGAGRPLDLDDYFRVPEDLRMAYTLLRNSGHLAEDASPRDIESTRDLLATCHDERAAHGRLQKLDVLIMRMNKARKRPAKLLVDGYELKVAERVQAQASALKD